MLVELWLKRARDVAPRQWPLLLAHALSPIAVTPFFRNGFIVSESSLEDLEKGIKVLTCLDLWNQVTEKSC